MRVPHDQAEPAADQWPTDPDTTSANRIRGRARPHVGGAHHASTTSGSPPETSRSRKESDRIVITASYSVKVPLFQQRQPPASTSSRVEEATASAPRAADGLDGFSRRSDTASATRALLRAGADPSQLQRRPQRATRDSSATACSTAPSRSQLYRKFPAADRRRAFAAAREPRRRSSLARRARAAAADFGAYLRLGEGELKSGGARRPSMLADAVEAVIGAAFLDGGFDAARDGRRRAASATRSQTIDPTAPPARTPRRCCRNTCRRRAAAAALFGDRAIDGEAHDQIFEVECEIDDAQGPLARRRHEPPQRRAGRGRAPLMARRRAA